MKHPKSFDLTPQDRKAYVRRPLNPSALHPGYLAVFTSGTQEHGTFREWSDWLRKRKR